MAEDEEGGWRSSIMRCFPKAFKLCSSKVAKVRYIQNNEAF